MIMTVKRNETNYNSKLLLCKSQNFDGINITKNKLNSKFEIAFNVFKSCKSSNYVCAQLQL